MATHSEIYLTCDHCGAVYGGNVPERAETPEELRDAAQEDGWDCDLQDGDTCPTCR